MRVHRHDDEADLEQPGAVVLAALHGDVVEQAARRGEPGAHRGLRLLRVRAGLGEAGQDHERRQADLLLAVQVVGGERVRVRGDVLGGVHPARVPAAAAPATWGGRVRPGPPGQGEVVLTSATRALRLRDVLVGLAAALLLAVPDLGRQLPVRDDPSRLHALLVDVVGVVTAGVVQVALIGLLAGLPPLRGGAALLRDAVRRRPGTVLAGLAAAGATSALITLVPSVLLLGYGQVLGPLQDPPLGHLVAAQASDVVATALTAAWFAVLVRQVARSGHEDAPPSGG